MYELIYRKYESSLPNFPKTRRPLVGTVIKGIRVDKGMRQIDFAKSVGINESTLKSIENDHQQATTVDNLEKCAHALDTTVDELILLGCERDPANYFVFKKSPPSPIEGIRKRKRTPDEWYQSLRIQFKDFDVTPCSPPINTRKDFFFARINLPPKRSIEKLKLETHEQVFGFVATGFNIKVDYAQKYSTLTGNQGFALDGFYPHSIINEDEDTAAVIYLLTKIPKSIQENIAEKQLAHKNSDSIDISLGLHRLREYKSERLGRVIPIQHLADMTDKLDRFQVEKLMRLKGDSSVIYWEKIQDLLTATNVSMDEFLKWCHGKEEKPFYELTAPDRSIIDYTYQGLKIHSATPPEGSQYFLGVFMVDGKSTLAKKSWERKNNAMIAIFVEDGELEVIIGKSRGALPILKGESIYFDGNLGYRLRNPSDQQTRGFIATYPGLQF